MTDEDIEAFLTTQGAGCGGQYCLKNLEITTTDQPADRYCARYAGGTDETAAAVIGRVSRACGLNPQVMLTTLQKESGLLDRTDPDAGSYDAAWGWHCPDTGPGGGATCDPAYAGFFRQAYGMAKQWARYRIDPGRYHYRAGQRAEIAWNVVESGCGGGPVTITNTATASLYNYTPYQPNAASLAAYPGRGDSCSTYGNRNFFFLFHRYFSPGGTDAAGLSTPASVIVPDNRFVDPAIAGRVLQVATPAVAQALRAGFDTLGTPYVWGGGGSGAGPGNGCRPGGGQYNSCGSEIGFDCSGLTAYVLARAGWSIPGDSAAQRMMGIPVAWGDALPGDIVGFPGHVAVYLGVVGDDRYILEASWVGYPVHIVRLTRHDADPVLRRYWSGGPFAAFGRRSGSTPAPAQRTAPNPAAVTREPLRAPGTPVSTSPAVPAVSTRPQHTSTPSPSAPPSSDPPMSTGPTSRTPETVTLSPTTATTTASVTDRSTASPTSAPRSTGTTSAAVPATVPSEVTESSAPVGTAPGSTAANSSTPGATPPAGTATGSTAPDSAASQAPATTSTLPEPAIAPTSSATVPASSMTTMSTASPPADTGCGAGSADVASDTAAGAPAGPPPIAATSAGPAPTLFEQAVQTPSVQAQSVRTLSPAAPLCTPAGGPDK